MSAVVKASTPAWLNQLEVLINKALSLDPETTMTLAELQGKVIGIEMINIDLAVFLLPSDTGLTMQLDYPSNADVLIKGSPTSFIGLMTSSISGQTTLVADMQIIGDIGLAQRFQAIVRQFDMDLEELLSRWVGDNMAYQIGKRVSGATRFFRRSGKTLITDISEYLQYEVNLLPDELLVEEFNQQVDVLRDDINRFEQRLGLLEKKIQAD